MSAFEWVAKRELRSTSVLGTVYTADIHMEDLDPQLDPKVEQSMALSGDSSSLLYRIDTIWHLKTIALNDFADGELAAMNEMLASVAGGEIFYFDPYGTVAVPVNEVQVELVKGSISKPGRLSHVAGGEAVWQQSFRVRVVG